MFVSTHTNHGKNWTSNQHILISSLFEVHTHTMAHLLSDLANYFNLEETNIDNWTFKLYYKVSMVICMTGATVGIASQYFGDPIR